MGPTNNLRRRSAFPVFFVTAALLLPHELARGEGSPKTDPDKGQYPLFDPADTPFSYAGSFLWIALDGSQPPRLQIGTALKQAVTLRGDRHPLPAHVFFTIAVYKDQKEVPYRAVSHPWQLEIRAEGGSSRIAFFDVQSLLFETDGLEVRLIPARKPSSYHEKPSRELSFVNHAGRRVNQLLPAADALVRKTEDNEFVFASKDGKKAALELRIGEVEKPWDGRVPDFESVVQARRQEVEAWMAKQPRVPPEFEGAARTAWFLLWHARVRPHRNYTRTPVLMSKVGMNQVWAWDNCFNALALAHADAELAWDQLFLFFDRQSPDGQLPDYVNDYEASYTFVKPPVYGWAITKLIGMLGEERSLPFVRRVYEPVARLTEWWYASRDTDRDGMCEYVDGNDSGWDNATVFDQGSPVEGADLAAHLVLQTEGLARMAELLGKPSDAEAWRKRSREQLDNLLRKAVKDDRFVSPLRDRSDAAPTRSLLNYVPMVLGRRLPEAIRRQLVSDLSPGGPFLTEHGLASESPKSRKYRPDGYWRGPIWAPSTYLIFEGLVDAGEIELARTVAERFCGMCAREPGFFENYDALTGKGQGDREYTWTASCFILMASWLHENG